MVSFLAADRDLNVTVLNLDLPDPKGQPVDEARATRYKIARHIVDLLAEI